MINKGRFNNLHLYEVTEQDLLIPTEKSAHYRQGNVLIFADKKNIDFGFELAKADDLTAAQEYLANSETLMYERIQELEGQIQQLNVGIQQREGLLQDLTADLRHERDISGVLKQELEEAYEKLEVELASRDELVGDLQQASAGTHTVEAALQKTLDEKEKLTQELATHVVDLVDLDLQNKELKRLLEQATKSSEKAPAAISVADDTSKNPSTLSAAPTSVAPLSTPANAASLANAADNSSVLTMSTGKQVHVYHEFSAPPKRGTKALVSGAIRNIVRIGTVVFVAAVVALALSVVATAYLNKVSFGEAFDILFAMI
ncbi:MAG: hypothetical protein FWG00_03415 [Coriobacteriia bacterium]|nr:hypothetical protein [Coriobacteriia bacterium]